MASAPIPTPPFTVHPGSQPLQGNADLVFYGLLGKGEPFSDLPAGKPFVAAQQEYFAAAFGQAVDLVKNDGFGFFRL